MDWLKLFALLIAVSSVLVTAQGTRKKIRIHIPQKVKHIHHHKKIYITNHSASSQYAPAYLPTAEALSLPSAVALPTVAGLVPLKPVPLFEERRSRHLQGVSPDASSLVPMYRARGFYGPSPTWESHDFDLVPPPGPSGPTAGAIPSAFSAPSGPAAASSAKRVKIIKVEPSRKKKIVRKKKPKRIIIHNTRNEEDEHPVSSFHEQFYADLEGAGTIRKIKKPKRVEKIIDGDTEHIHTYSEEHIHKIVFDDHPKLAGLAGIDPSGAGVTALASNNPLLPLKNAQALLSLDPSLNHNIVTGYGGGGNNLFSDLGSVGSLGTSGTLEYSHYNPREVTHDHVFHDHGEIPPHLDLSKEHLGFPPKVSYTSQGHKVNGQRGKSRQKNRWVPQNNKPLRPHLPSPSEFSYYENMYSAPSPSSASIPPRRPARPHFQRPKLNDESSSNTDISYDDYQPIPSFRPRDKTKLNNHGSPSSYQGHEHKPQGYRSHHSNSDVPFSTSSTVFHDIPHKAPRPNFSGVRESPISSLANFKDPFTSFKDIYSNNFEYDAYASPSNSNPDGPSWPIKAGKGRKKSISTQNISFGGQDHKTVVDHLADVSNIDMVVTDKRGSHMLTDDSVEDDQSPMDSATSATDYTITEFSPAHDYYTSMALKAFHDEPMSVAEASNTNFQVVEAPTPQTNSDQLSSPATSTPKPLPSAHPYFVDDRSTTIGTTSAPTYSSAHTMKIPKKPKQKSKLSMESHHRVRHTVPPSAGGMSTVRESSGYVRRAPPRTSQTLSLERDGVMQRAARAYERPQEKVVHIGGTGEHSRTAATDGELPTARGKLRYGDKLEGEASRSF